MTARHRSLDVFRGATVALMILVNNPGTWSAIYPPLAHAPWHGWTPTDLVFPFFLFAVGNALALVLPALQAGPATLFWRRVAQRTLLIFAIGLLLNASPFVRWDAAGELVPKSWDTLRLMGVLQRIALCFGAAAAIVWLMGRRGALIASGLLLLGYWAACVVLGASGDAYSLQGWFGTALDRALLGESHLYRGEGLPFDPEGLASTPPAIAQVLLGWWVGDRVRRGPVDAALMRRMALVGLGLVLLAGLWHQAMPINKKIWTSSYVLLTTGLATGVLALGIWLIEIRRRPLEMAGWVRFFEVFGRNPLFIFVLSGLVPRGLALLRWPAGADEQGQVLWTSPLPWVHQHVFAGIGSDPRLGSLLFALANLALYALLAWWLDSRRIYVRV
jgi:predicted acyltransferase